MSDQRKPFTRLTPVGRWRYTSKDNLAADYLETPRTEVLSRLCIMTVSPTYTHRIRRWDNELNGDTVTANL